MTVNKLFKMIRRDRPAHQVPQALRDLDRTMLVAAVDEQQEAVTLAKARETVLADRALSPSARPTSVSHPKPTTRGSNHRSLSRHWAVFSWALLAGAAIVLPGIVALIAGASREATTAFIIMGLLNMRWLVSLTRFWVATRGQPSLIRGSSVTKRASLLRTYATVLRLDLMASPRSDGTHHNIVD